MKEKNKKKNYMKEYIRKINQLSKKEKQQYALAFLVPCITIAVLRFVLIYGIGTKSVYVMPWAAVLCCGMGSFGMFHYMRNAHSFSLKQSNLQLICALSYGFCAYGILQQKDALSLLVFALFPLVFLQFEKMLYANRYIPFIIGCTILLVIKPQVMIPVTMLLFVLSLIELIIQKRFSFAEVLHISLCFLFTVLLAAFRLVFYLAPYIDNHDKYSYSGFFVNYSPVTLLAKLFPGFASSRLLAAQVGRMDLYFGLFCVICVVAFFCHQAISGRKRICYGVFTLFVIGAMEFSPIYYVVNLFMIPMENYVVFSFFFMFWCIRLGAEFLGEKKEISGNSIITVVVMLIGLGSVTWLWSGHNFNPVFLLVHVCLVVLYAGYLWFGQKLASIKWIRSAIFLLVFVEYTLNVFVSYHMDLQPENPSSSAVFCYQEQPANEDKEQLKEDTLQKQYEEYLTEHQDEETMELLLALEQSDTLDEKEIEKYCGTILPDRMQKLNGLCHKYGIQDDLFESCDLELKFDDDSVCTVTNQGHGLYHFSFEENQTELGLMTYTVEGGKQLSEKENIFVFDDYTENIYELSEKQLQGKEKGQILVWKISDSMYNIRIAFYQMNPNVLEQVRQLNLGLQEEPTVSYLKWDIIAVIVSYLASMILFVLCCYNDKEKIHQWLKNKKKTLLDCVFLKEISRKLYANRFYLLAFLIPALSFVGAMIVTDCTPFGNKSFFDSDGLSSSLPLIMDNYYMKESGNRFLSMNMGYGFDMSLYLSTVFLASICSLFPKYMVGDVILFGMAAGTGLCAVTMMYYMVHRKSGKKVDKQDFRVLLPALIYGLNSYVLSIHCFFSWYIILILFPLIMLSMDAMMEKGKVRIYIPYVLVLGLAIVSEIQLAMFVCIFLVIRFFSYPFDGIKDFFKKGFTFAFSSLMAGGCGFLSIYRILTAYGSSRYQEKDSVFPSFGLHGSFFTQWKKFFAMTETFATSKFDGDLSVYCGVFALILVGVYFCSKQLSWNEKLRRMVPVIILLLSFNEQVLSYLWNGMHYQSKVPNRYAFLLIFLLAEFAYDGMLLLRKMSIRRVGILAIAGIIFVGLTYQFGGGIASEAIIATLLLVVLGVVIFTKYRYCRENEWKRLEVLFVLILAVELSVNVFYQTKYWGLDDINFTVGDYVGESEFIEENLKEEGEFLRCCFLMQESVANIGELYNTGSNGAFSSYLNNYQYNLHKIYGFTAGLNYISALSDSTPVGLSLAGDKYLILTEAEMPMVCDAECYEYIGKRGGYYVLKNKDALSLGTYVPEGALEFSEEEMTIAWGYYNALIAEVLPEAETAFRMQKVIYSQEEEENSFCYYDSKGNKLTMDEAWQVFQQEEFESNLWVKGNLTPEYEGRVYLCSDTIQALGMGEMGENRSFRIELKGNQMREEFYVLVMNQEVVSRFLDKMKENQLENITIHNDTITGTTSYEEDGYTMFSVAYDKSWKAYVDGEETEILCPYGGGIYVKTPAGKHTIELKMEPYGLREGAIVSIVFFGVSIFVNCFMYFYKKKEKECLRNI